MAKIVKLGRLLPEDITFELPGGQRHTLPGDPPLELILKIASLFERIEDAEESNEENVGIDILRELDAEVLKLMQMRDPSVVNSPCGVLGVQHVVSELLSAYNFGAEGGEEETDPPKPTAKKSTRSSGSQSS
jgi:hypothetical protein